MTVMFGFGVAKSENFAKEAPPMTVTKIEPAALIRMLTDMIDTLQGNENIGSIGFVFTPTRTFIVAYPKAGDMKS